jgi:hypothetical protein
MKRLTKRGMRLGLITVGIAGLLTVFAVPGAATPGVGFGSDPKARGYLAHGNLRVNPGADVLITENIVARAGSSGWHSHPGGAIVIVKQGQITTYRSVANDDEEGDGGGFHCVRNVYNAGVGGAPGDAFIEAPGEALIAKNTFDGVTIVWAVFPGLAHPNGLARTDVSPNPGTCSAFGV